MWCVVENWPTPESFASSRTTLSIKVPWTLRKSSYLLFCNISHLFDALSAPQLKALLTNSWFIATSLSPPVLDAPIIHKLNSVAARLTQVHYWDELVKPWVSHSGVMRVRMTWSCTLNCEIANGSCVKCFMVQILTKGIYNLYRISPNRLNFTKTSFNASSNVTWPRWTGSECGDYRASMLPLTFCAAVSAMNWCALKNEHW